jgi:glycine oxidase
LASKRVIIAGGGLIGCSIAWKLAGRGTSVQVIESARPGMAASHAAAGMLAPLFEAPSPSFRDLAFASLEQYPQFVAELQRASGIDAELLLTGKLDVAFSDEEFDELAAHYGAALPASVREVDPAEEAGIAPDAQRMLLSENDGSVDTRKLGQAAYGAAANAGVEFNIGVSVQNIICDNTGFVAVQLSNGDRIDADAIVVCAGAWSGTIEGLPQPLPVFPVRGQMVALECVPRVLERIVMTRDCYIVPRSLGRVLVGSTVEHVGFDARTTAEGVAHLLQAAERVVPKLADAPVVETWAGLRPGTPDDLPILGADPRAAGVFYATGHFRNGILLAPITADLMTAAICGDASAFDLRPFSVDRFDD